MTLDGFRRLALNLPEACEVGHMGHPDFRVGGKIFATLGYPDANWGMVKLHSRAAGRIRQRGARGLRAGQGGWGLKGADLRVPSTGEGAKPSRGPRRSLGQRGSTQARRGIRPQATSDVAMNEWS